MAATVPAHKITTEEWRHINAGEMVSTGYAEQQITAPADPGRYTMYELVDNNNCHLGFDFEKEVDNGRI